MKVHFALFSFFFRKYHHYFFLLHFGIEKLIFRIYLLLTRINSRNNYSIIIVRRGDLR